MKRIIIISFLTSILTGNLFCQVLEKEIYEVMNQLLEINNVEILSKTSKTLKIENPRKHEFIDWCVKTGEERIIVSQIDSAFIIEQIISLNEIKWKKDKIDKSIKIKKNAVDYFTIPLFLNQDKNLVIVFHGQYCSPLSFEGKYELYKLVNGKWRLINIQLSSVS